LPEALTASSTLFTICPLVQPDKAVSPRGTDRTVVGISSNRSLLEKASGKLGDAGRLFMNGRTDTEARYLSRGESCGNCRAMETVEKSFKGRGSSLSDFSTSFHSAWKTLRKKQKRGEFSTVPTASAAGFFSRKEPVSRRRYPGLCYAETYSHAKAHRLPGDRGWLPRKHPAAS